MILINIEYLKYKFLILFSVFLLSFFYESSKFFNFFKFNMFGSLEFLGSRELFIFLFVLLTITYINDNYFLRKGYPILLLFSSILLLVTYFLKLMFGRGADGGFYFFSRVGMLPSGHTITLLLSLLYLRLILKKVSLNNFSFIYYTSFILLVSSLVLAGFHFVSDIALSMLLYYFTLFLFSKFIKVNKVLFLN